MKPRAVIVGPKGLELPLTDVDRLWAARMVLGEGEKTLLGAEAVLSAMLRRLVLVQERQSRTLWTSLTRLLVGEGSQAGYSQPIAVQWRYRGPAAAQRRRAWVRSRRWSQIPTVLRCAVDGLLSGRRRLTQPRRGVIHFADASTSAGFLSRNPGSFRVSSSAANTLVGLPWATKVRDPEVWATDCALFGSWPPPRIEA